MSQGRGKKKKKVFLVVSRIVSPWLWRGQTECKIDSLCVTDAYLTSG